MTSTAATASRVTYTSANVDWDLFHRQFDEALAGVRDQLGRDYALYIGGEPITSSAAPIVDTSPIDREIVLGRFASAGVQHVDRAVTAARAAQRVWAHTPWRARVATLRGAAGLIRQRKFELAAIMSLEVGKSRLESMGDAEESADLIDYYCQQVEDANGFVRQMAKVTPVEGNSDVLRPYGVFACIAPFNFPLALSTGMSSAALVAGNAVVYKPAQDTPWSGLKLHEVYRDAGLPPGVFNYLTGRGAVIGDALWQHPGVDGQQVGRAVAQARREGTILLGGQRLTGGAFDRGHFVAATIAELPLTSSLFLEELFVPLLAVGRVAGLDEAIAETNKAEYGLTAGIFSKKPEEIERFFDEIEAGVCYVNKRTGATTGAWPGAQPFTGWKGSGSAGKGGSGPYYVAPVMREQGRTVIWA